MHIKTRRGNFVYGGDRDYLGNLDKLPFPALNKVKFNKYNVPIRKAFPISSILTSRGCPFHCIFCFHSMGYEWRARTPQNVIEEIEWQVNELGIKEICIQDDNFLVDVGRAREICDLILKRNIKVKLQFQNGLKADHVDFELFKKMYHAGVWLVGLAPETGSIKIRQKIRKDVNLEKIKQVIQWCREIGINTYTYFMTGFPFEDIEDLRKTASLIEELNTDFMQLARVMAYPKTPLYEMTAVKGANKIFNQEKGCFFGGPKVETAETSSEKISRLIKQIHRNFYLNPLKIAWLVKNFSLPQLIKLFLYSLKTGNI